MLPAKIIRRIKRRPKGRGWKRPPLTERQILAWADEHFKQTGRWPNVNSGRVRGSLEEHWKGLDNCLRQGTRGLPKGGSLARLLARERGVRNPAELPPLSIKQILSWADEHHEQTGEWPNYYGTDDHLPNGETWIGISEALRIGRRGQPGGDSLARLLDRERGVRNKQDLPPFTIQQILAWADQYHAERGGWPTDSSEPVAGMKPDRWTAVDAALRAGLRGLPGGDSLPQILARERKVRNPQALPTLSERRILSWADDHRRRTGHWPTTDSGTVLAQPDEVWVNVGQALRLGLRGLDGGDSLARLLARKRGVRNRKGLPPYKISRILAWADAYWKKHGEWPHGHSGPVESAPGETWTAVEIALSHGTRGLPGGDSLARLLARRRGKRNRGDLPQLTVRQILAWADAHFERYSMWPSDFSGPIDDALGETWQAMNQALRGGLRGLPGGSSLAKLLKKHRGVGRHVRRPPLSVEQILAWADEYHRQTGRWPNEKSGPVAGAPSETWGRIQLALRAGKRGLSGGESLTKLFVEHRGVRSVHHLPPLHVPQILRWARAYFRKHRRWPNRNAGPVDGAPGENWAAIDVALKGAHRGLPGGSSLARLLNDRSRRGSHPRAVAAHRKSARKPRRGR